MSDGGITFDLDVFGGKVERPVRPEGEIARVDILERASDELVEVCRRYWPQASADDFDIRGTRWTDRATGTEYRVETSRPLLGADPRASVISSFCVRDGRLVYLRRRGAPEGTSVVVATATSRKVVAR